MLHRIFGGFPVLLVFLVFASVPASAAGTIIDLKQEVSVRSDVVHLEDVADLRGAETSVLRKLAQVELGSAPEYGATSVLTRQQIQVFIQASGFPPDALVFAGATAVQIGRKGKIPDPDEISAALKAHILKTTSWKASEVEIRSIGGLNGMVLPPDDVEWRLAPGATLTGRKKINAPIDVVQSGKTLRSFWVSAEIAVRAPILTASRKISCNKVIAPEDVVENITEIPDLRISYLRRPEDLIGKVARRSFSPGDPLALEAFAEPFVVRHGETVQLRLERNGIVLTSLAKAEQDGRIGQIITVRNLEFSTSLKAQVAGRGVVKMQ